MVKAAPDTVVEEKKAPTTRAKKSPSAKKKLMDQPDMHDP
jgi:hypothetical protein